MPFDDSDSMQPKPLSKSQAFRHKAHRITGSVHKHVNNFKARNSDENRLKRIKSKKLELTEENLKTSIVRTKQRRKGKGVISKLGSNQNPRHFGLQSKGKGFGANTEKMGSGMFGSLGLGSQSGDMFGSSPKGGDIFGAKGQGNFKGMDGLFGSKKVNPRGSKVTATDNLNKSFRRNGKVSKRARRNHIESSRKKDGLNDLF